ncbi:DUF4446 family protein [Clostridium botulinum]|uniref:DUF4446 family protein n=1 Tax=Clostridium botulinum TaxID=1491 RepID=A0A0C2SJY0_CLOBO|nr:MULTISPECIES: DUF4446 family protein [Clostridium]ACD53088.1 conserved hypothetical protein [Clostridium botulinum E3 str. Alaska E43]AJF31125.1 hypothetical protein ST13_16030 [Clostridium botulinum]AJF34187.1 hypothetical protein ST12_16030 [Clostridium botulinum]EES50928.1 conserved hypothetical protein [Clostridium botulinum E1 str. 'BoNT E Beluga']KAI3347204.1 DUF4446 family protein [Clostridium botulinum]
MEKLFGIINQITPYLIIGMIVIIVLLFILIFVLINSINKLESKYRRLMRGTNGKNLEEMLMEKLDSIDDIRETAENTLNECSKLETKIKDCVQKVAIMRYKAFENVGSDLSFSIAMLDDNNDGILLTGIYARDESTTYAKPIDKGISRYDLSEEELYVLNEAANKYKNQKDK